MFEGKVEAALHVLNESGSKADQPLSLSSPLSDSDPSLETVCKAIISKHPDPAPISPLYSLLSDTPPPDHESHFVKFESIDGMLIRRTIMHMDGAAGPSGGMDVSSWKKMCSSFAIIHCVRELYQSGEVDGVLCVDASNAFNASNRGLALCNILHLCPSFGRLLINMYRSDVSMFIDGDCILSKEGTTQGDPLQETLPCDCQRLMDVASERGASVWLSALPIIEHGFDLHKRSFRDAL